MFLFILGIVSLVAVLVIFALLAKTFLGTERQHQPEIIPFLVVLVIAIVAVYLIGSWTLKQWPQL